MGIPNNIPCGNCMLIAVTQSNVWFIEELFRHDDVKKYYVLRDDHAANIRSFCQYIVNSNIQNASLNYIIFNDYGDEVGFISAEPVMNRATGMPMWNVGYAVHPAHRRKGYASSAVTGLSNYLLQNFSFQQVMLDICEENIASTNVAKNVVFLNQMTEQDTLTWNIQKSVCVLDGSNNWPEIEQFCLIRLYTSTDKNNMLKL